MRRRGENLRKKWSQDKKKKNTKFLIIPAVVLVLILIIILVDKTMEKSKDNEVSTEYTITEKDESSDGQAGEDEAELNFDGYELKKDEITELTELIETYCQAKLDCDPMALAAVFGQYDISELEMEEDRVKMELVSRMVDGYENISCYSIEGPEEGTYVIYPYFEVQYKDIPDPVPYLTWGYAKRDVEGQFYMTQDISEEVETYIAQISQLEEVRQLLESVENQETGEQS